MVYYEPVGESSDQEDEFPTGVALSVKIHPFPKWFADKHTFSDHLYWGQGQRPDEDESDV